MRRYCFVAALFFCVALFSARYSLADDPPPSQMMVDSVSGVLPVCSVEEEGGRVLRVHMPGLLQCTNMQPHERQCDVANLGMITTAVASATDRKCVIHVGGANDATATSGCELLVVNSEIISWKAPNTPVFRITLNQRVNKSFILDMVYFVNADVPDGIRIKAKAMEVCVDETDEQGKSAKWDISPDARLLYDSSYRLVIEQGCVQTNNSGLIHLDASHCTKHTPFFYDFKTYEKQPAITSISCVGEDYSPIVMHLGDVSQNKSIKCSIAKPIEVSFNVPVNIASVMCFLNVEPTLNKHVVNDACRLFKKQQEAAKFSDNHKLNEAPQYDVKFRISGLQPSVRYTVRAHKIDDEVKDGVWARATTKIKQALSRTYDNRHVLRILDMFGNSVEDSGEVSFTTSDLDPECSINEKYVVLEKILKNDVLAHILNLKQLSFVYGKMNSSGVERDLLHHYVLRTEHNKPYVMPLQIRKMLNYGSGFIVGRLHPVPSVYGAEKRFFAQVTPFSVLAKFGYFNSKIWVTDLSTGKTICDAKVTLSYGDDFMRNIIEVGRTDENGIATLSGTNVFDPAAKKLYSLNDTDDNERLTITVAKENDIAVLPAVDAFGINTYGASHFLVPQVQKVKYGTLRAVGITAKKLYKPGDLVQYKLYIRDITVAGATSSYPRALKYTLNVYDSNGKSVYRIDDVEFSEFGTCYGSFSLPLNAVVGKYDVALVASDGNAHVVLDMHPLSFVVSDTTHKRYGFIVKMQKKTYRLGDVVSATVGVKGNNHNGDGSTAGNNNVSRAAYHNATGNVSIILQSLQPDFVGANAALAGFIFDDQQDLAAYGAHRANDRAIGYTQQLYANSFKSVDNIAHSAIRFPSVAEVRLKSDNTAGIYYGKIVAEFDLIDEHGVHYTSTGSARYLGVDRFVGLRPEKWIYDVNSAIILDELVVDGDGNLVADAPITTVLEKKVGVTEHFNNRHWAPFNTYGDAAHSVGTEGTVLWKKVADFTSKSDAQQVGKCVFVVKEAGEYRVTAMISDTRGERHATVVKNIIVKGCGPTQCNHNTANDEKNEVVEIVPEKQEYHVGDVAHYTIKDTTSGDIALVSVERDGVLENFVQNLNDGVTLVDLPIKKSYFPGFFLSVNVFSPRLGTKNSGNGIVGEKGSTYAIGTNGVMRSMLTDGTKPRLSIGYVKTKVSDAQKDIKISINMADNNPTVGEHILTFASSAHRIQELMVAVVDCNDVLCIDEDDSVVFDMRNAILGLKNISISNFSLVKRLLSKKMDVRPIAGGGGLVRNDLLRDGNEVNGSSAVVAEDDENIITYWSPSVITDSAGKAEIKLALPNTVTKLRVMVIASDRDGGFGAAVHTFDTLSSPLLLRNYGIIRHGDLMFTCGGHDVFNLNSVGIRRYGGLYNAYGLNNTCFSINMAHALETSQKVDSKSLMSLDPGLCKVEQYAAILSERDVYATCNNYCDAYNRGEEITLFAMQKKGASEVTNNNTVGSIYESRYGRQCHKCNMWCLPKDEFDKGSSTNNENNYRAEAVWQKKVNAYATYGVDTIVRHGVIKKFPIVGKIVVPYGLINDASSVTVSASPSVIGDISTTIRAVLFDQHDCWESHLSRALVMAYYTKFFATKHTTHALLGWDVEDTKKLEEEYILKTLRKMRYYQTASGGLSYCDISGRCLAVEDGYLSAYTMIAITHLKDLGYTTDESKAAVSEVGMLRQYLHNLLREQATVKTFGRKVDPKADTQQHLGLIGEVHNEEKDGDTHGIRDGAVNLNHVAVSSAMYGLSMYGDLRYEELQTQSINTMLKADLMSKAYYLGAAFMMKSYDVASALLQSILSGTNCGGGYCNVWFTDNGEVGKVSETDVGSNDVVQHSELLTNCVILDILSTIGSSVEQQYGTLRRAIHNVPTQLVRSIRDKLDSTVHIRYGNVHENAICTTAIANYSTVYEGGKANVALDVKLGSQKSKLIFNGDIAETKAITHTVDTDDVHNGIKLELRAFGNNKKEKQNNEKAHNGKVSKNTADVARAATQQLYYSVVLNYVKQSTQQSQVNNGFDVKREYSLWQGDKWVLLNGSGTRDNAHVLSRVQSGDIVRVDLYVTTQFTKYFVVLEDQLAGMLQPVGGNFDTAFNGDYGTDYTTKYTANNDSDYAKKMAAPPAHGSIAAVSGSENWITYIPSNNTQGVKFGFCAQHVANNAVRFYAKYLKSGNYHVSYLTRVGTITDGVLFAPAQAMELYDRKVNGATAVAYMAP